MLNFLIGVSVGVGLTSLYLLLALHGVIHEID